MNANVKIKCTVSTLRPNLYKKDANGKDFNECKVQSSLLMLFGLSVAHQDKVFNT